jgi:hypothetical protein
MAVPSTSSLFVDREAKECKECPETKAARLEKELDALRRQYLSQLREFSAMASLRETIAGSVLQVTSNSPNEYSGPGYSPGDTNVSSQNPPHGAEVSCFGIREVQINFPKSTFLAGSLSK